jgi:hypothetical protein
MRARVVNVYKLISAARVLAQSVTVLTRFWARERTIHELRRTNTNQASFGRRFVLFRGSYFVSFPGL